MGKYQFYNFSVLCSLVFGTITLTEMSGEVPS